MSTIFSKILRREIPADIVHEDEFCLAFKDVQPQAPVHILIIPKIEIRSLAEVKTDQQNLLGHLMVQASLIAKKLGVSDQGYRVVINTNENGGQSVYHLHLHLLAGRPLKWPPG
jgi:histidine triad (HIT) family protein